MDSKLIKNVLDLQFQKYLIIASTSIIIAFTYLVGVVIAFITGQIEFDDILSMSVLFIFSIAVLGYVQSSFSKHFST